MRKNTVVYPGTFDPIHKGHVDLVERASNLFDRVVIGIAESSKKQPLFSTEERIALTQASLSHLDNIEVKGFSGLSIRFVEAQDSNFVLTPSNTLSYISSSLVREIASMNGDVSDFVPEPVLDALNNKFSH